MQKHIEVISHWKEGLRSKDVKTIQKTLQQIIRLLKQANSKKIQKAIYEIIINCDLCNFIYEVMTTENFFNIFRINIIICHLSECPLFYKNEFYWILKRYLRLLNTINDSNLLHSNHHECIMDVFKTISLMLDRALQQDLSFQDKRFLIQQFLTTISKFNRDFFYLLPPLQFLQYTSAILLKSSSNHNDRDYFLQLMMTIFKKWKLLATHLTDPNYFISSFEVICNLLDYISSSEKIFGDTDILITMITDKSLFLVNFAFKHNIHHEMLYTYLHYLLIHTGNYPFCQVAIINEFIKFRKCELFDVIAGKNTNKLTALVNLELIVGLVAQLLGIHEQDIGYIRSDLHTVLMKKKKDQNEIQMVDVLERFLKLNLNLDQSEKSHCTKMSAVVVKGEEEKLHVEVTFLKMIFDVFAECFSWNLMKKDAMVMSASSLLGSNLLNINPTLSENFLKWINYEIRRLKQDGNSQIVPSQEQKEYILKYISREIFNIQQPEIFRDHWKWLLEFFLDTAANERSRINIMDILLKRERLTIDAIKKLMSRLKECYEQKIAFETIGILDILSNSSQHFNFDNCKSAASCIYEIFKKEPSSLEVRASAVECSKRLVFRYAELCKPKK